MNSYLRSVLRCFHQWPGFALALVSLALAPAFVASASGGFCPACEDRSYTKDLGECKVCAGVTTSGEFQLCLQCSSKLNQCQHCRKPLPNPAPAKSSGPIESKRDDIYKSGRWEYRYAVRNQGSRSEGYFGELLFDGQPVPSPRNENDFHQTPFGPLYWVGQRSILFGGHGWMPKPLVRAKIGKQLPEPGAPAAATAGLGVRVMVLGAGNQPVPGMPPVEPWIAAEVEKLGGHDAQVWDNWTLLGAEPLIVENSRHYGECQVGLSPRTDGQPFLVHISGGEHPTVELPRQAGAKKLVKVQLTSSIAQLDLYLAFQVGPEASTCDQPPEAKP